MAPIDFSNVGDSPDIEPNDHLSPEIEIYPDSPIDQSVYPDASWGSENLNLNGPIVPDLSNVISSTDYTSSGVGDNLNILAHTDLSEVIWSDLYNTFFDCFPGLSNIYDVGMHGTPYSDIEFWDEQDDLNSCAISTTSMMFNSIGIQIEEPFIAELFKLMDIYDPATGTNPFLIDEKLNLLADLTGRNFEASQITGFSERTLSDLLDDGIRPLVAVDSWELYGDDEITINEVFGYPDAGHAVQVTGYDGDYFYINDPGFPEGAGQQIPVFKFMNAANDFGFTAVSLRVA